MTPMPLKAYPGDLITTTSVFVNNNLPAFLKEILKWETRKPIPQHDMECL